MSLANYHKAKARIFSNKKLSDAQKNTFGFNLWINYINSYVSKMKIAG